MTTARSPRRRPRTSRRDELVAAAARVVARDGVAATTTRRIAEEAGLPLGLVHYWFASKDELLEEVVMAFLGQLESAVPAEGGGADESEGEGVAGAGYVTERLRAVFKAVRNDDPGRQIAMYELTTWALRTPGSRDLARRQYAAYRETAARLAGPWLGWHGAELPSSADVFVQFLSALFDGLVLAWLADPEAASPDAVLALVGQLLAPPGRRKGPTGQTPPA